MVRALAAVTSMALAACVSDTTNPRVETEAESRVVVAAEITFYAIGESGFSARAQTAPTVALLEANKSRSNASISRDLTLPENDPVPRSTIQLVLQSSNSFILPANGSEPAMRYISSTFAVRNARLDGVALNTPRSNLTFMAVSTTRTLGQTPVRTFNKADGTPADPNLAIHLKPTGAVTLQGDTLTPLFPDVLQLMTEVEAAQAQITNEVTNTFPYAFMVRRINSQATRALPASPANNQFDGVLTVAYKIPLQSDPAQDPRTISVLLLGLDDSETRISQSPEEFSPSAHEAANLRGTSLGSHVLTLVPQAGGFLPLQGERVVCQVRTAGTAAAPLAQLFDPDSGAEPWFVPYPFTSGPLMLPATINLAAGRCPPIPVAGPVTFPVNGQMSGRARLLYSGIGTNLVRASHGLGSLYFNGEQIEATLTTALGGSLPRVARWRIAARGGSATFEREGDGVALPRGAGHTVLFDVDLDGDLDVALGGFTGSRAVLVYRNDGAGKLALVPTTIEVGNYPHSMVAADFDRDGDTDLAVTVTQASSIAILTNTAGTLAVSSTIDVERRPEGIEATDVDGDGDLDLIATSADPEATLLLNNGAAAFAVVATPSTTRSSFNVTAADVDADFDMDLVLTHPTASQMSVLLNNGLGGFGAGVSYPVGIPAEWSTAADFDGDGDNDIGVSGSNGRMMIMQNNGSGAFTAVPLPGLLPSPLPLPFARSPAFDVVADDFDADGDFDIATARSSNDGYVQLIVNGGAGQFSTSQILTGFRNPAGLAAGDMDRDGDIDLVVAHDQGRRLVVLLNQ